MISVDELYKENYEAYAFIFIALNDPIVKESLHVQPKGRYIRAFCQGWDKLEERYKEILAYANAHNLELSGYAYEKGINEIVVDSLDDYITQIEILIK